MGRVWPRHVHRGRPLNAIVSRHKMAAVERYTPKQGQYLAFIYYYCKIHGRAPSEGEMQAYFGVSPPSVHQMILALEARGLIERTPGQARSIELLLARGELPDLD